MAIPNNIEREHIFQAIIKILKEGVPPRRQKREWAFKYEDELYPVKLVISWANIYANKEKLSSKASVFTTYTGQKYLKDLGFEIVRIDKYYN